MLFTPLTSNLANRLTSNSVNLFISDFASMFITNLANVFTSGMSNIFTSDLSNMFTTYLTLLDRAVGNTVVTRLPEKCAFPQNCKTLRKINMTGYFFELMYSLTDHLFRRKGSPCTFTRKSPLSSAFRRFVIHGNHSSVSICNT